jgi:hypothetical protein
MNDSELGYKIERNEFEKYMYVLYFVVRSA